jgi:methionine-rich copper-binding protein CopC
MKRFKLAIAAFLVVVSIGSTNARAHAQLDHANPAVGSTIGSSPGRVTLTFTQALEPKFSGAEVRNSAGARVDTGHSASGNTLSVSVKGLPPGAYSVSWHVLSVDTHKTQGSFSFRVGQ